LGQVADGSAVRCGCHAALWRAAAGCPAAL
jgi:hypothetical protein